MWMLGRMTHGAATGAALLFFFILPGVDASGTWTVLKDCVLVENASNDADSFHVRHGNDEYLLRLYFVDAPETNARFPDRVREQAEWFGTTEERVLHVGEAATVYVTRLLGSRPFTAYTQFIDARGASSMDRVFAMVKVDGRYLCELLVQQGFARIYGIRRDLPDGTPRRRHERRLADLEKEARWRKAGLWGDRESALVAGAGAGRGRVAAVRTVTLTRDTAFYTTGMLPTFRGYLRKGDVVELLSASGDLVQVRAPFRGHMEAGQCRRGDLGM